MYISWYLIPFIVYFIICVSKNEKMDWTDIAIMGFFIFPLHYLGIGIAAIIIIPAFKLVKSLIKETAEFNWKSYAKRKLKNTKTYLKNSIRPLADAQ